MARDFVGFDVLPDDRWPVCPDNGPVLKAVCNDCWIMGWYTEKAFQIWLETRNGRIVSQEGDVRHVVAELTKKEQSKIWVQEYKPGG